jgi:hypothetical protein
MRTASGADIRRENGLRQASRAGRTYRSEMTEEGRVSLFLAANLLRLSCGSAAGLTE